jgi:hypothetical protein
MNPMSEGLRNWPPIFQLNQPIPFEEDQRLEFKRLGAKNRQQDHRRIRGIRRRILKC